MDYELTYFPTKGRAEFLRLIFTAAGQEFKDTRLCGEEWQAFKPKTPMGLMPVLTIKDGEKDIMLCQTNTIANYLGKSFGLHGSTDIEEALISEFLDSFTDTMKELFKWFYEKDEKKKAEHLTAFTDVSVPEFVKYFNRRREYGNNGYIIGSKLSIADIDLFAYVDQIKSIPGLAAFDKYPEIEEHFNLVKSNRKIAKWHADHDETKK